MSQATNLSSGVPQTAPFSTADAAALLKALVTTHSGASRPAVVTAEGEGLWIKKVSGTQWEIYYFDGTSDILLFQFNPTTHLRTESTAAGRALINSTVTADGSGNVSGVSALTATGVITGTVSGAASAAYLAQFYNSTDGVNAGSIGVFKYGSAAGSYGPYAANHVGLNSYGATMNIGTEGANSLVLYTSNAARLTINSSGAVAVVGALSKGSGSFLIDHPLDPLDKDLKHGFVEAPRYDLLYRGRVTLANGQAMVDIDAASRMTSGTFAALTQNAEVVSLCNRSGFARVRASEIAGGTFSIMCEDVNSTDDIVWAVLAERHDPFIINDEGSWTDQDGRLVPERDKPDYQEA